MARIDTSLLEAALVGYQAELQRNDTAMADIRKRLGCTGSRQRSSAGNAPTPKKQHGISAEGRARIAEAQRKRWAAAKKQAR
jgi:hypothetical protein